MAVDREARERLAEAIMTYMRELRPDEFYRRTSAIAGSTSDWCVKQIARQISDFHDDFLAHPEDCSVQGWELLRRIIAFCRTDLKLAFCHDTSRRQRLTGNAIVLLAVSAMLGLYLSLRLGYFRLAGLIMAGGVAALAGWSVWGRKAPKMDQAHSDFLTYWPFANQRQWLEHQCALNGIELPSYDPAVHARPPRTGWRAWKLRLMALALISLVLAWLIWVWTRGR